MTATLSNSAAQAFYDVCHNEQYDSIRDLFEPLGIASRAVLSGELVVRYEDIRNWDDEALQRAGYLLHFLCGWSEAQVYDTQWPEVEQIRAYFEANGFRSIPFYHSDVAGGYDMIAKDWGLTRGVDVAALMKLTEPPYMV